ncbi:MAG: arylamine N-acetyltransferase [Ardenticatenaceae bacterium]|nr:arylamine N-acetyltransferase [Ardenticatenaceae bacterium]
MTTSPLSPALTAQVLAHLHMAPADPSLAHLEALIAACIRLVPWESAFRIAKRARTKETADCPRWPLEFWQDNMERGGGGTCFESNYAFYSLLLALGYDGYLTINNMGDKIGCHTAVVLHLDGQKWLADVGIPLYAPLLLDPHETTTRATPFLNFAVVPDGPQRYQIERWPHPARNVFTLIDEPVPDDRYRAATTADYGPNGLFLDKIVINKIINERPWRFNSSEQPWQLNSFMDGIRTDKAWDGEAATAVAAHFGMDTNTVRQALAHLYGDSVV